MTAPRLVVFALGSAALAGAAAGQLALAGGLAALAAVLWRAR